MMLRRSNRRGAVLIESALVYPILFLLVFAILTLSLVVFRKQQVTHLASQGARYACVRGAKYKEDTGNAAATLDAIRQNAVLPAAAGMDPSALTVSVAWVSASGATTSNAQAQQVLITDPVVYPSGSNSGLESRINMVSVTVTYVYQTGMFGNFTLTSTCTVPMQY